MNNTGNYIKDGILYVDNEPYLKRMAFFGYNHWMTNDEAKSLGNFMKLDEKDVGTSKDYYTWAGFNGGAYSCAIHNWENKPEFLLECIKRAKKVDQKITLHTWMVPNKKFTDKYDMHWIDENGKKIPFGDTFGMCHNPELYKMGMREVLESLIYSIRDGNQIIGYQIGGERWPYDFDRLGVDVSFDDYSLNCFREYLKDKYNLSEISKRYQNNETYYNSFDEIYPPITTKPFDYRKNNLKNWDVARWDWWKYRKQKTVEVWLAFIDLINELDNTGRPIHHEHGHGPYNCLGFLPFQEICDKANNFSVGSGNFGWDLSDVLSNMMQQKACGNGPWISNELNSGTAYHNTLGADLKRELWGTLALGAAGYNIWTFFNLLGAKSEFTDDDFYTPNLKENLPIKYYEIKYANEMLESIKKLISSSKAPKSPIKLLLLDDSIFLYKYTNSYLPDCRGLFLAGIAQGYADQMAVITEYHLRAKDLNEYKVIILPRSQRIINDNSKILCKFVENGGTLVLMGETACVDEKFNEYETFPYGELGEIAGIEASKIPVSKLNNSPIFGNYKGEKINMDVRCNINIPKGSNAKVLVNNDEQILATVNTYQKGKCVYLAGPIFMLDYNDETSEVFSEILKMADVNPTIEIYKNNKIDTGLFTTIKEGEFGKLIFIVENDDIKHNILVKLDPITNNLEQDKNYNVFDCFSDESYVINKDNNWGFNTKIDPVGVKVFVITQLNDLSDWLPNKMYVKPDKDDVIYEKASLGEPFLVSSSYNELIKNNRSNTVNSFEVEKQEIKHLSNSYIALDIKPFVTNSINEMVLDVGFSNFINYGNIDSMAKSSDILPIKEGVNDIGDIPVYVVDGFVTCDNEVNGIEVNSLIESLHFFHGGHFQGQENTFGYYRINYSDGTIYKIPIVRGVTISDFSRGKWQDNEKFTPKTVEIWNNGREGKTFKRLTRFDWINPYPNKNIDTIDIVTTFRVNKGNAHKYNVWGITAKI